MDGSIRRGRGSSDGFEAEITLEEVDLVEVNETFAAQSLAVLYEWGMDHEDERLNPNGGAIALGHPLRASGARTPTTCGTGWRRCA